MPFSITLGITLVITLGITWGRALGKDWGFARRLWTSSSSCPEQKSLGKWFASWSLRISWPSSIMSRSLALSTLAVSSRENHGSLSRYLLIFIQRLQILLCVSCHAILNLPKELLCPVDHGKGVEASLWGDELDVRDLRVWEQALQAGAVGSIVCLRIAWLGWDLDKCGMCVNCVCIDVRRG